jgi:NAD(P)-dependent dehydrogenase (short-subunit alcohol dehydrogenase family)
MKDTETRRVAVVTGASRGLGAVVARLLARRGFDLVLSARLGSDDLEQVVAEARAVGSRVRVVPGDLVYERTRESLVQAAATFGGVDLVLNNASELGGIGPLTEVPLERLERLWRINVMAPLALTRVLLPLLTLRRGVVVNISSDAAQGAYAGWGAYGSTKAALELIGRTLAVELADRGVSVINVDPGDMRTRMHQEAFPGEDISDRPLPDITLPFFEWLLDHLGEPAAINGTRFQAQSEDERWAVRV